MAEKSKSRTSSEDEMKKEDENPSENNNNNSTKEDWKTFYAQTETHPNFSRVKLWLKTHRSFRESSAEFVQLSSADKIDIPKLTPLWREHYATLEKHSKFEESRIFSYIQQNHGDRVDKNTLATVHTQHTEMDDLCKKISKVLAEKSIDQTELNSLFKKYEQDMETHLNQEEQTYVPIMLSNEFSQFKMMGSALWKMITFQ